MVVYPSHKTGKLVLILMVISILCSLSSGCKDTESREKTVKDTIYPVVTPPAPKRTFRTYTVKEDVKVRGYFEFMDNLVVKEAWRVHYPLNEHLIVWANPWIIDTLENTDYYRLKERGVFSYDQQEIVILPKGTELLIPDSLMVDSIQQRINATLIDVNIPEFRLRIKENGKTLYNFPVRVGKHTSRYLAMAGKTLNLETKTGSGIILQVNKNAVYMNPVDNKRYYKTHRDDGESTLLPRLPWLIPEINGQIYGQLIHPTTNPVTLGRPSSNGCIGMKEADIWRVYYHAPTGTKITIRYDLQVVDENGDTLKLPDIYKD
ncbi:MAG: L,D-transpeptidase [Bacteroidia bacterium]|nr:L,D-transpeptidase [Bacteroidia bacterium]